jgi:hypothetical protein
LDLSLTTLPADNGEHILFKNGKRRSMSEKYYSVLTFEEGDTFYVLMDPTKPFDQMLRWVRDVPQGDGKTTELYYLDPATFWDKVSDKYIDSR